MGIDPISWEVLENIDRVRRLQGATLDALGFGSLETSYETVFSQPGVTLRRYGSRDSAGPLLLMIPAPIKRPYIFDLAPEVSVVRRCLDQGARVFLVEWQPAAPDFGLAEFADRLLLASLEAAGEEPPILIAHSLGGLLAAVFAALHPDRIRALVLLAAPLHFAPEASIFRELVSDRELAGLPGFLPGSFLSLASVRA